MTVEEQVADLQDEQLMIQHEEYIEECESVKEDDMHGVNDEPLLESQLEAHVEPMMDEDEQLSFGLAIDKEQTNAQAVNRAIVILDSIPLHEYIDRACNIVFPLLSIIKKGTRFSRWIL